MTAKKKYETEEKEENLERWLLTYADMITLLVAFFIIMYAMSVVNLKKFQDVAIAIRSGFGGVASGKKGNYMIEKSWSLVGQDKAIPTLSSPSDETIHGRGTQEYPQKLKTQAALYRYIASQLANLRMDEVIQPVLDNSESAGNRFVVILSDQLFFEKGSAELSEKLRERLKTVGLAIKDGSYKLTLSGYCSPFGSNTAFRDSWELSSARACRVAEFLQNEMRINPRRLSVLGYGAWKDPGKSQRVAFTSSGQWKNLDVQSAQDTDPDRVILSMILD